MLNPPIRFYSKCGGLVIDYARLERRQGQATGKEERRKGGKEKRRERRARAGAGGKSHVNQTCYGEGGKEGSGNGDVTRAGASLAKEPRDAGEGSQSGGGSPRSPNPNPRLPKSDGFTPTLISRHCAPRRERRCPWGLPSNCPPARCASFAGVFDLQCPLIVSGSQPKDHGAAGVISGPMSLTSAE